MKIRGEIEGDHDAVRNVVEAAFGQPYEADLVEALRSNGDDEIALVAAVDDVIVGYVMLSPMKTPSRCLGLAPVSVLPEWQSKGIGSALIREGLSRARDSGWLAVFVLGEPAYYERFGFRADLAAYFKSPFAGPYFMAVELVPGGLKGHGDTADYSAAFQDVS